MRAPLERKAIWPGLTGFVLTLAVCLIGYAAPSRFGSGPDLLPNLVMIGLFIWSVRRPWFVSPPVLLLVGVLQDLLTGGPMGVWALAYLIGFAFGRVRDADGAGAEVGVISVRFAIFALIAFGVAWAAGSVSIGAPVGLPALITEAALTILLFPAFAWAFARRKERSTFS